VLIRSLARVDAALPPRDPPTPRAGQRLDTPAHILRQTLWGLGFSGNDVNERHDENNGARPLHEAARRHESAVPVLLTAGAEVDAGDDHGTTALHLACTVCRTPDIVRLLLEANADVNKRDIDGSTPLHWAIEEYSGRETFACVRLLLDAGADATLQNGQGFTPLHKAAYYGNASVAKALIAAGADPNVKDLVCQRGSPYAVALDHGHRRVLRVLLQHGAVPDAHVYRRQPPIVVDSVVHIPPSETAWLYHDRVVAAGGYDALVKQHRKILASVVDKVVEAKFGRRAPQEVCAHAALFIAPPGGS
jgi:ankyrin repeat protein